MNQYVGSAVSGATAVTKEYPVANGVTVHSGDFVYLTGGRVTNASIAGQALLGMVVGQDTDPSNHEDTQTTTGDTDGTKKVLVIVEPNAKFAIENDNVGTTFSAAHVGQRFDLTGAGGAQLVDTSTVDPNDGTLECIEFGYDGDDAVGLFIIADHRYKV